MIGVLLPISLEQVAANVDFHNQELNF